MARTRIWALVDPFCNSYSDRRLQPVSALPLFAEEVTVAWPTTVERSLAFNGVNGNLGDMDTP
jgi:hypothetical protein